MNKKELEYLKENSHCLSILIQLYEYILNEIKTDEYNDKVKVTKKQN